MTFTALVHKHWLNIAHGSAVRDSRSGARLSPELPAVLAFIFGGVLLAVIDWKIQRLPTRIVYSRSPPCRWVGVRRDRRTGLGAAGHRSCRRAAVRQRVLPHLAVSTKFTGMMMLGFGDVRLAAVLGLLLGWYGLPYVLYGASPAISWRWHRRRHLHPQASAAPAVLVRAPLIAGTLAVVLIHG
jgi:prepilin signal peptidase PulO-like enzyme (type II secretory pathway)